MRYTDLHYYYYYYYYYYYHVKRVVWIVVNALYRSPLLLLLSCKARCVDCCERAKQISIIIIIIIIIIIM